MKRVFALILALSMVFALAVSGGGQAYAAAEGEEVGSEMWMLRLLAATALGDSEAMAALGRAYYTGEGVEKDPAAAFGWLQKAADAGNVEVLVTLGDMYLNGESVAKDPEQAYEYYTAAAASDVAEARDRLEAPEMKAIAERLLKKSDGAYLSGHWGEIEWIRNGTNNPFYLDETVKDAEWVEFYMTVPCAPRGYPYDDWYLYAMDERGNWGHVAKFALDSSMTQGETVKIRLDLDKPSTFKALTITSVYSGMDFTLWRFIDFYVDPSCVPEAARNALPPSLEEQFRAYAGKQPPLTQQIPAVQTPAAGKTFYGNYRPDAGTTWGTVTYNPGAYPSNYW